MFKLNDCVTYIASNALKDITEKFNDLLVEKGSTRSQWIALYFIANHKGINQTELADKMNIKTPTLVRLIDKLEQDGFIFRQQDQTNRRIIRLECTQRGYEKNLSLLPVGETFSQDITRGIPDEELDAFVAVLSKLLGNLKEIDKKL